jgi:hypothetical protein
MTAAPLRGRAAAADVVAAGAAVLHDTAFEAHRASTAGSAEPDWERRDGRETNEPAAHRAEPAASTDPIDGDDGFLNVIDYLANVPAVIPWIVPYFVYEHGVTLIAGSPKAGKSTLAAQMQRSCETDEPFLGAEVKRTPVLLATEEGGVPVAYKVRGLTKLTIYDRKASKGETFAETLAKIARWAERNPGGIVFIDTFAVWAKVEDENDAAKVTAAMEGVNALAANSPVGIVLIHHARKGGGTDGEGVRGSGALVASVDLLVEMKRTTGARTERYLDRMGRVVVQDRLLIDFDPVGRGYALLDMAVAGNEDIDSDLVGIPPIGVGGGLSLAEIAEIWGKNPRRRVYELVNKGRLKSVRTRVNNTHKNLFWAIPAAYIPTAYDDER